MSMLQRSFAARLACALALVAAAALLRYALEPWLGGNAAFLLFAPAILARLIEHYVNRPAVTGRRLDKLTERETEVLALVARGMSNTEIANALTISVKTVKTHIGSLLAKLHARDRAQLVRYAYRRGLARP